MEAAQANVMDTFVRVQRFLDDQSSIVANANKSSYRALLDDVVANLADHAVTQTGARRAALGKTAKERVVRNALRINYMRPIAAVAAAKLRDVPEFTALKMPPVQTTSRNLVACAGAMCGAASAYEATFMGAGLDTDFIAQLRHAADQLSATIADRGATKATQVGATAGLFAECTRGRQAVRVLDALVEPQLGGDTALLAAWKSAKQYTGRQMPITEVSVDAAAELTPPQAASNG